MQSPPSSPPPSATSNGRSSRVFSESDETQILKCLIRATKSIPPPIKKVSPRIITRIVKRLDDRFSPTQISDKVRRLRDKYQKQARSKSLVRTHHDRTLFKLSKRIWGKKKAAAAAAPPKKKEEAEEEEEEGGSNGAGAEVVSLDKFPHLVAEFSRVMPENEVWRERMEGLEEERLRKMDQDWVFIKVEEAKLVAKKAELMQQQIREVIGGENGFANANANAHANDDSD